MEAAAIANPEQIVAKEAYSGLLKLTQSPVPRKVSPESLEGGILSTVTCVDSPTEEEK